MDDWKRNYLQAKRLSAESMLAIVESMRADTAACAQWLVESFIAARAALEERLQREQDNRDGTIVGHQEIARWNLHPYMRVQGDSFDIGWMQVHYRNGRSRYKYLPCRKGRCDGQVLRSLASVDRDLVWEFELKARMLRKYWDLDSKIKESSLRRIDAPQLKEGETA